MGGLRSDAYAGGVGTAECEVEGREAGEATSARRLADEADSLGCGVPCRDLELSSFSLLSFNSCSNCIRRSCAQASSYWPSWDCEGGLPGVGSILMSCRCLSRLRLLGGRHGGSMGGRWW